MSAVAVVHPFPTWRVVEGALCRAIKERRLVTFTSRGLPRRAEPHDLGVVNGATRLFFYQVGGRSCSGAPLGWRWAHVEEIADLRVLSVSFPGPRDTGTNDHVNWDRLIASVSRSRNGSA
jgi:hypothetical protein